jgi:MFS family permease
MERKLQNNIIKIYLMVFCQSAMPIAAVFVPLLQGHGLSMTEIMYTQALFALTIVLSEVPGGYLADLWGRKNTLICGAALSAAAFGMLLRADDFADFLLYECLLGIGISLSSGVDLAIFYDTQSYLERTGVRPSGGKPLARLFSIDGLAGAFGALSASVLLVWSLESVVVAQVLFGLLPLVCAITLVEPPREVSIFGHRENVSRIRDAIIKEPLVLITAIAMIVFGLAAIYAFWLYQKYWEVHGVPLAYFGYLWAAHCAIRGIAAHFAHEFENSLGPCNALILVSALSIAGFVGMALAGGWFGVCLALLLPLSRGISAVIFSDALNRRISAEFRATLNSLVSLGFRAVFIVTAPLLGWLVDRHGVDAGIWVLVAVFTPAYALVLLALFGVLRKTSPVQSEVIPAVNA